MGGKTVSGGTGARGNHATGTNLNEFVSFLTLLIGCFCSDTNTQSRFDPKPKANCPILGKHKFTCIFMAPPSLFFSFFNACASHVLTLAFLLIILHLSFRLHF